MLCCYGKKQDRKRTTPSETRDSVPDSQELHLISNKKEFSDSVFQFNNPTKSPRPPLLSQEIGAKIIENKPMFITEIMNNGNSPYRRESQKNTSLSTIFSSFELISPSSEILSASTLDASHNTAAAHTSDDLLREKISVKLDHKDNQGFYNLTWITPDSEMGIVNSGGHSTTQKDKGRNISIISSNSGGSSKPNHPIQRIIQLRSEGSYKPKISHTESTSSHSSEGTTPLPLKYGYTPRSYMGSQHSSYSCEDNIIPSAGEYVDKHIRMTKIAKELSHILEGSETDNSYAPVFETPDQQNPYYPNPNTPVSDRTPASTIGESEDSPYLPPANTPVNTTQVSQGSDHMARAIWSHNRNDLEESSYIYVNNIQVGEVAHTIRLTSLEAEQQRLRHGSHDITISSHNGSCLYSDVSTLPSLHSGSQLVVPIHCSTIHVLDSENTSMQPSANSQLISDLSTVNETVAEKPNWHYNQILQAYEGSDIEEGLTPTVETGGNTADISSSNDMRGGYLTSAGTSLSHPSKPTSIGTSLAPQVGSRDTSHPSNCYDPPCRPEYYLDQLVGYDTYTDSSPETPRQAPIHVWQVEKRAAVRLWQGVKQESHGVVIPDKTGQSEAHVFTHQPVTAQLNLHRPIDGRPEMISSRPMERAVTPLESTDSSHYENVPPYSHRVSASQTKPITPRLSLPAIRTTQTRPRSSKRTNSPMRVPLLDAQVYWV